MQEFTATVLDCCEGKKGFEVILSATAFYPEGGGQPYDTGILQVTGMSPERDTEKSITWEEPSHASADQNITLCIKPEATDAEPIKSEPTGTVHVLEVHEKNGELIHYTDAALPVGAQVCGKIDWERRFDLMQQHSGEHIVSGLVHAAYGYDNVGFHMGSDVITIDFNGSLDEAALQEIEAKANEVICQNQETKILYPSAEELKTLPYRSKKELTGEVRIVEFPKKNDYPLGENAIFEERLSEESKSAENRSSGKENQPENAAANLSYADMCACCGLHVARAGEIGMIKLLSVVKFRDGVRIEMISGKRVLSYLNMVNAQNHQISVLLSAKPDRTADAVKRSLDENFRLKGRVLALEEKLFAQEAERLAGAGDVLLFEKDMEADSVRKLAVAVMETCGGRCAVFSDNGDGTYKYALGEKDGDLRALVKEMNQALEGRGGGKPFFAQGSVHSEEKEIRQFFDNSSN
ncbi:MAG: DHHA1 domain-containing protein [Lachnospiraceae bacterium]|nr:DHHA1 domain-containing protein [Lachnospiraceae bacterium]